jgi:hypothetical protein
MANPLREFPLNTIVDGLTATTLNVCEVHVVLAVNVAASGATPEWRTLYNENAAVTPTTTVMPAIYV